MPQKINIVFVIPSLRAGGAERVMSFIAMNLSQDHFAPRLIIIGSSENQSYEIKGIPVVFLNKKKVRNGLIPLAKYLSKNKADIVFGAMTHVNSIMAALALFFPKTKFVGRETIVKSAKQSYKDKEKLLPYLFKFQAKTLHTIICQSTDMKMDMINNFSFPKEKLVVINNPITNNFQLKLPREKKVKQLITVGRLTKQKGYFRILKTLAKLKIPFHYTIIGNGSERENILQYIQDSGLVGKVSHISFTNEVERYLGNSDLYLQGSYVEGFPNALLESCAVGTPVLAFEAPGGINEIIQEGTNGYIADNEDDFHKKLIQSLERKWNASDIRESVTSRYSEDIILKQYEDFFCDILK